MNLSSARDESLKRIKKSFGKKFEKNYFVEISTIDGLLELETRASKKLQPSTWVKFLDGSPVLVVMGLLPRSKGRGFKSRHHILDGHNIFSHIFVVRIVTFV